MIYRPHFVICTNIAKSQTLQQFSCFFDISAQMLRLMGVAADRDDLSPHSAVAFQDIACGCGIL